MRSDIQPLMSTIVSHSDDVKFSFHNQKPN